MSEPNQSHKKLHLLSLIFLSLLPAAFAELRAGPGVSLHPFSTEINLYAVLGSNFICSEIKMCCQAAWYWGSCTVVENSRAPLRRAGWESVSVSQLFIQLYLPMLCSVACYLSLVVCRTLITKAWFQDSSLLSICCNSLTWIILISWKCSPWH